MNSTLRDRIEKCGNRKISKRGIYLHHLGLKFTYQQLQQLNGYFADLEMNTDVANRITKFNHLESQVERVLLRLNFIIGTLDDRFMSTFLIKLDQRKVFFENSGTYSYLIRLDQLSLPRVCKKIRSRAQCRIFELDNEFQGFGKIQLKGETLKQWIDFVDDTEFLRQDEVRRRYAELMTKAISAFRGEQFTKPYDSKYLFHHSHSLVVDADVLQHVLNMPPEQRLFYALSTTETKDWLNFDIHFNSSGGFLKLEMKDFSTFDGTDNDFSAVTIKLYLGINFEGLPMTTDYPLRIPLYDSHALLHQQAATSGFYMVAADPKCVATSSFEDTSILWRFQFPVVEQVLCTHYSNYSVFARMANIVYNITSNMQNTARSSEHRCCPGRTVVSKYMIKTLVWFQLEIFHDPLYWTSNYLALHTLSLLDRLIAALKTHSSRSYFFARFDLMKNTSSTAYSDDRRFITNGKMMENFVRRVHSMYYDLFGYELVFSQNRYPNYLLRYENVLTRKWNEFLNDGRHNRNEKSRKRIDKGINHYYGEDFSQRQLEYLVQVMRGVLFVCSIKSIDMKEISEDDIYANTGTSNVNELLLRFPLIYNHYRLEYVMRIVLVMIEQSFALYVDKNAKFASSVRTNRPSIGKLRSSYSSVFKYRKKIDYDKTVSSFLNGVRATVKDDFLVQEITDDVEFVRYIMKLLISKINQNKRIRRILKPYLNRLVLSAHSNCWFLDSWRDNMRQSELTSLRIFARLLSKRKMSPYNGLMDALYKGWQWPVCIVKCLMMLNGQKMSLMSQKSDGSIVQFSLNFSVEQMKKLKYQLLCNNWSFCNRGKYSRAEHLFGILNPNGGYDDTDEVGIQTELRKIGTAYIRTKLNSMSPITYIIENQRRYGVHKYLGNIIEAFVLLDKFSSLREICSILPKDKRKQVLEDIHFISREKYRSNLSFRSSEKEVLSKRRRNSVLSEDSEFLPTYRTLNDCSNDKNRFDRKVRQQPEQQEESLSDRKSFISLISSFSSVLEVPYENC